jgi:hypothetical protein
MSRFLRGPRKRRPSSTDATPARETPSDGGIGGSRHTAYKTATNDSASNPYAHAKPNVPTSNPPSSGPTVKPALKPS